MAHRTTHRAQGVPTPLSETAGPVTPEHEPSDGFSARLREIIEELATMGATPLRLAQIDVRLIRFGEIEDETMLSEEQYRRMTDGQRRVFDAFSAELHRQKVIVRSAYDQPEVIADAFSTLEAAWRLRNGGHVDRSAVLVLLRAYPRNELLAITTKAVTAAPGSGASRRSGFLGGVLRCETWYVDMLLAELGSRYVSEPLRTLSIDEQDAVLALWDDEKSSEFHDLHHVLDAVRRLG